MSSKYEAAIYLFAQEACEEIFYVRSGRGASCHIWKDGRVQPMIAPSMKNGEIIVVSKISGEEATPEVIMRDLDDAQPGALLYEGVTGRLMVILDHEEKEVLDIMINGNEPLTPILNIRNF